MKNKRSIYSFLSLYIFFSASLFSQNVIEFATKKNENSYTTIAVNYINDAVFMGRKDSISSPYLYPSLSYHHKSGLYAKSSFSYLTKSNESRIDLYLFTLGLDFNTTKFYADISATKYFFNTDSYNIISEVKTDITANLKYDFNIFNIAIMASNYFNDNNTSDFFLSTELSHDFITTNNKFQFSPTIGAHFGSQNFYETYYTNKQISEGGNSSGNGSGTGTGTTTTTTTTITESEKFKIMAIEFSLPIWYINKKYTLSFLPVFAIPQSETTILIDDTLEKENLKNTFYWILGVSYKFN